LFKGNILIDDQGVARICDFGQARIFMEEGDHSGMTTTSLHRGTERYLPHELVTSDDANQLTKASDVYSMGCVGLFVCLIINT
jgi:serine/threonine protein kinase